MTDLEQQSGPASSNADSRAPAIQLPKGGGAIRGIGEKFAANPVTGTGTMSVPIATSPGRSGFGPQLSLSYDSGSGNGPFGFGWSLSLPSITRKTDKGLPRYHDAGESDVFILSGAEDLVPVPGESMRTVDGTAYRVHGYRPRVEGLFARIERWTSTIDATNVCWRSVSRDNITTWYGRNAESRICDPADAARIFSWLICQSHDDKGTVMVYGYKAEDSAQVPQGTAHERNRTDVSRGAQRYLKHVRYGNREPYLPVLTQDAPWPQPQDAWHFETSFDYGEDDAGVWPVRSDPFSSYRSGFEVRTYRICQRVLMLHHFPEEPALGSGCVVHSTDFVYSADTGYTFLKAVTHTGYRRDGDGGYERRSLPHVEFEYSEPVVSRRGGGGGSAESAEPSRRCGRRGVPLDRPARRRHSRHSHRAGQRLVLPAESEPDPGGERSSRRLKSLRSNRTSPSPVRSSWISPETAAPTSSSWPAPTRACLSTTTRKAGNPFAPSSPVSTRIRRANRSSSST